jgi:hypothetical protein
MARPVWISPVCCIVQLLWRGVFGSVSSAVFFSFHFEACLDQSCPLYCSVFTAKSFGSVLSAVLFSFHGEVCLGQSCPLYCLVFMARCVWISPVRCIVQFSWRGLFGSVLFAVLFSFHGEACLDQSRPLCCSVFCWESGYSVYRADVAEAKSLFLGVPHTKWMTPRRGGSGDSVRSALRKLDTTPNL